MQITPPPPNQGPHWTIGRHSISGVYSGVDPHSGVCRLFSACLNSDFAKKGWISIWSVFFWRPGFLVGYGLNMGTGPLLEGGVGVTQDGENTED